MTTDRMSAAVDDPAAIPAHRPLRYDWHAEGAVEAARPAMTGIIRVLMQIAQRTAKGAAEPPDPERKAS